MRVAEIRRAARVRIVSAALEREARGSTSNDERRKDGLQHERRTPRRTDREVIITRLNFSGFEDEFLRTENRAVGAGIPDLRGCFHRSQVLPEQTRLLAARADVVNAEGLISHER